MAVDDAFTVSLLHMDGDDESTTFTDESGKSWTANGNAQIDTAQKKFGSASGLFDGTGDYIDTSDHADWRLDDGDNSNEWTIDFWVRFNGDPSGSTMGLIQQRNNNNNYWTFNTTGSDAVQFQMREGGTTKIDLTFAWNPAGDTWYHVALVKDGTNGYMVFINGTQVGSTQTDVDPLPDLTGEVHIGLLIADSGASYYLNGWLDEIRVSKGIARWTSNFTPPQHPYGFVGGPPVGNIVRH